MKRTKLSGRYAEALHQFALEQNQEEAVYADIQLLDTVFKENRELRVVIESPIMPAEKKNAIFNALFDGKISNISLGFLRLIITKRREPALSDIFANFIQCYNRHHHIKVATITTAVQMNDTLLEQVKKLLEEQTKSTILLKQVVNPKIIGGIVIHVDDFLFDGSIIGKINKLRTEFSHNIYQSQY